MRWFGDVVFWLQGRWRGWERERKGGGGEERRRGGEEERRGEEEERDTLSYVRLIDLGTHCRSLF